MTDSNLDQNEVVDEALHMTWADRQAAENLRAELSAANSANSRSSENATKGPPDVHSPHLSAGEDKETETVRAGTPRSSSELQELPQVPFIQPIYISKHGRPEATFVHSPVSPLTPSDDEQVTRDVVRSGVSKAEMFPLVIEDADNETTQSPRISAEENEVFLESLNFNDGGAAGAPAYDDFEDDGDLADFLDAELGPVMRQPIAGFQDMHSMFDDPAIHDSIYDSDGDDASEHELEWTVPSPYEKPLDEVVPRLMRKMINPTWSEEPESPRDEVDYKSRCENLHGENEVLTQKIDGFQQTIDRLAGLNGEMNEELAGLQQDILGYKKIIAEMNQQAVRRECKLQRRSKYM